MTVKKNEVVITRKKMVVWLGANILTLLAVLIYVVSFISRVETKLQYIEKELDVLWTIR